MACATMATHWVSEEFVAESCGGVKSIAQRGKGSKSFLHFLSFRLGFFKVCDIAPLGAKEIHQRAKSQGGAKGGR